MYMVAIHLDGPERRSAPVRQHTQRPYIEMDACCSELGCQLFSCSSTHRLQPIVFFSSGYLLPGSITCNIGREYLWTVHYLI